MSDMTSPAAVPPANLSRLRVTWEILGNVLLSFFFLQFLLANVAYLQTAFRLSTLLLVIKVATDVLFYLIRRMPKEISIDPYDWVIAIAGTYMISFFRPDPSGADNLFAQGLQCLGALMQVAGMLSLNKSIGIAPANRGVKTQGMYRFVRHPLYLSYVISFGGFLLNQPSWHNAMVYLLAVTLWVLRLLAEERFLNRDPEYRAYSSHVRWRLIPFVF